MAMHLYPRSTFIGKDKALLSKKFKRWRNDAPEEMMRSAVE
jgi:hypothetical protein